MVSAKTRSFFSTLFGPLRALYKLWFVVVFLITGSLLFPFLWLTRELKWTRTMFFIKSWIWLPLLHLLLGLVFRVKFKNKEHFPKEPFIICGNHTSYLDVILLYSLYRRGPFYFLGKASLRKVPFLGMFFKGDVHVPIVREVKSDASQALQQIGRKIDLGYPIVIFPEGTQSRNPPQMNSFKAGAFKIAIEKQVSIVPVTFLNNFRLLSNIGKLTGPSRPGLSKIIVHEPISTVGLTLEDLLTLQQQVHKTIEKELINYYPDYKRNEN